MYKFVALVTICIRNITKRFIDDNFIQSTDNRANGYRVLVFEKRVNLCNVYQLREIKICRALQSDIHVDR